MPRPRFQRRSTPISRVSKIARVAAALGGVGPVAFVPSVVLAQMADAHVHLSFGDASALERLVAVGITVVRDCGGEFEQLAAWRNDIAAGKLQGPKMYIAGPLLDGPKPGLPYRVTVETPLDAERVVDSLAALGVDFIKTHNAIPPDAFLAVVRQARARGLKVAAHLPRGVPAWMAAEAGVGSIEHAAESLASSPVYAGFATDALTAMAWWESPAGEAAIQRLAESGVTVVPTLARYRASIDAAPTDDVRAARADFLPQLLRLVGRLHDAGVPILVGSDLVGLEGAPPPEMGPSMEIQLLERAGLSGEAARAAASAAALERWFAKP